MLKKYITNNKMETKFFAEIEKSMDLKTIKDFEKEIRTKINTELESMRKKNLDLNRVLLTKEVEYLSNIKHGKYTWLVLHEEKKKKLFRLIEIYSQFSNIIDSVIDLNKKVEDVKKLKDSPVDGE